MVLKDDCVKDLRRVCVDCGTPLNIHVQSNDKGYFIGFYCPSCKELYSRESPYFQSFSEAIVALTKGIFIR